MNLLNKLAESLSGEKSNVIVDSAQTIIKEAKFFSSEGKKHKIVNPPFEGESDFSGKFIVLNGEKKIDLTRLDYLAIGSSKEVKDIIKTSIENYDLSCPASQMVMKSHPTLNLEKKLAEFHSMKDSILFTNGYSVNDNLMQALGLRLKTHYVDKYIQQIVSPAELKNLRKTSETIFFIDAESHYSLQHGARIAKYFSKGSCSINKFPCADYEILEKMLKRASKSHPWAVKIIVSDALSSISGKIFDMDNLFDIAEKYGCILYIDEAHSTGALGPQGRGIAYASKKYQSNKDRTIIMGTLTKAFCQIGGYVTLNDKDYGLFMRACSPQYIFSAPISPWISDSICQIIDLVMDDFGDRQRNILSENSEYMRKKLLRHGFNIMDSNSQIIPVVVGNDAIAEKVKNYIEERGFMVSLFKYPAVPENHALIRFSLCADITKEEIDQVIGLLIDARKSYSF